MRGIRSDDSIVYICKAEPENPIITTATVGTKNPVYCTSLGKAIMAARELEEHMECAGAPVFGKEGHVIGAISVSSLYKPSEDYEALGRLVSEKALQISRLLGFLGKFSFKNIKTGLFAGFTVDKSQYSD